MTINRLFIAILILLVTGLLIYFFVFPKYQEFKSLQMTVGLKQAEFHAKYAYYAEVNKIFNELSKRKESLEKIDKSLPNSVSLANLVYFLQKKGTESGLNIKSLFFTKASVISASNPMREIVFSMNTVGGYSALKNFLANLEKSSSLFNVNSISFSSPVSMDVISQLGQQYSFTLEISTHSY